MNDNEKLIERARNWGQSEILSAPVSTEALIKNLVLALRDAEKAHTPTNDERGMSAHLRRYQDQAARLCGCTSCQEWLAESACRSEKPEPRPCRLPDSAPPCIGCRCGAMGPQDEPSDAERHRRARIQARIHIEHEPWWNLGQCRCGAQLGDSIDWRWHLTGVALRAAGPA